MHQSYAAICLISTRKVPRHGLDFCVTARLKSQCPRRNTVAEGRADSQMLYSWKCPSRGCRTAHSLRCQQEGHRRCCLCQNQSASVIGHSVAGDGTNKDSILKTNGDDPKAGVTGCSVSKSLVYVNQGAP